jgi:hypothetical protein
MTDIEPKHGATLIMDDICPVFIKLAKRLNQLSNMTPKGFSTITVTVLIVDGEPLLWMRPEVNNLATSEPKGKADEFLEMMKNVRK